MLRLLTDLTCGQFPEEMITEPNIVTVIILSEIMVNHHIDSHARGAPRGPARVIEAALTTSPG
jgi:hypothetical protein